jgi:hypothetical protein
MKRIILLSKIVILIFNLAVLFIMNYKIYNIDTDKAIFIPLIIVPLLFIINSIIGIIFKSIRHFVYLGLIIISAGSLCAFILAIF